MTLLNNPAVAPYLPVIMLLAVLAIGVMIRYSGDQQPVAAPPPPPVHQHDTHQ